MTNTANSKLQLSQNIHVDDVLQRIQSTVTHIDTTVGQLHEDVQELLARTRAQDSHCSDGTGKEDIPGYPDPFHGRKDDVATIVKRLTDKHSTSHHAWITGTTGIGKTALALAVINDSTVKETFGKYRFWVPCFKATSPQHLLRTLYTQLSITARSHDSLDTLIQELSATPHKRLILLDRFETSWSSDGVEDRNRVEEILIRLGKLPNVALLVTITSEESSPPKLSKIEWMHHRLELLDPDAAVEIFNSHYPNQDPKAVKELMDAIDRIPMFIKLIAIEANGSQISVQDLLAECRNGGSKTMDERIKTTFDMVTRRQNIETMTLLAVLSMLPAGTRPDKLGIWAPTKISNTTVSFLHKTAFVPNPKRSDSNPHKLVLFAIFRSYIQRHGMVPPGVNRHVRDACYKFVLDHKSYPDDSGFKDDLAQLASEEDNIYNLLRQKDDKVFEPKRAQALVAFSYYFSKTKQSIEFANLAKTVAKAAGDDRSYAETLQVLGKLYHREARYSEACDHFDEARRLFKKLRDKPQSGECTLQLVRTWRYMAEETTNLKKMKKTTMQAVKELSSNKKDHYHVSRAELGLGHHLLHAQEWEKARTSFTEALNFFEKSKNLGSASECLHNLARIEATQTVNYPLAIDLSQKALEYAEESGDDSLVTYALGLLACYHLLSRNFEKAAGILLKSHPKAIALGDLLVIALVNEQLGYLYAATKDRQKAIEFYQDSRQKFDAIGSTIAGDKGRKRCDDNLKILQQGEQFDFRQVKLNRF